MSSLLLLDELRKINWLWGSDRNPAQRERESSANFRAKKKRRKDFAKKNPPATLKRTPEISGRHSYAQGG